MKRLIPLFIIIILLIPPLLSAAALSPEAQVATIPTISIVSVVRDQSVTIRTHNYPANQTFTARMGPMGTRGVGGTVVGTTQSGAGGSFLVTYDIPAALQGAARIAIRLDSPQGFFSFNWFHNATTAVTTPATPAPVTPVPPFTGIPTFSITGVVRDQSVTIRTNNFPANQTFTARMGPMGTRGIGGTVVGTIQSGQGGALNLTFDIPAALRSSARIAIRLDSPQGFFAYNWFHNTTVTVGVTPVPGTPVPTPTPVPGTPVPSPTPVPGTPVPTPTPGYTGIPTFSIVNVVHDQTVTIRTNNFPPNQTFTARMGPMGTRGIGGIIVGTTESGAGGAFNVTYNIPAELRGSNQISIRLESPAGFFAFNWFYNTTLP